MRPEGAPSGSGNVAVCVSSFAPVNLSVHYSKGGGGEGRGDERTGCSGLVDACSELNASGLGCFCLTG